MNFVLSCNKFTIKINSKLSKKGSVENILGLRNIINNRNQFSAIPHGSSRSSPKFSVLIWKVEVIVAAVIRVCSPLKYIKIRLSKFTALMIRIEFSEKGQVRTMTSLIKMDYLVSKMMNTMRSPRSNITSLSILYSHIHEKKIKRVFYKV